MLERSREWIAAHGDAEASQEDADRFFELCTRSSTGVPIAHILGRAYFYGREFVVNDDVLVPRPETEHLIDEALDFIGDRTLRVLDVGTGSGAIACTIAAQTGATVDGTDSSRAAVDMAIENARRLGVADRCRFHHGDLSEPVRNERFDVIVANLPYIPTNDLPKAPDPTSFEPRQALDGGPDGLAAYRRLLPKLPSLTNEGGMILLEAAPPTIDKLASIVRSTFPHFVIEGCKDYAGLARYIKAYDERSEEALTRRPASCCGGLRPERL